MASLQEETSPMESVKEEPADTAAQPGNPGSSGETSCSDASSLLIEDDAQQDASLQESTSGDGPLEREVYAISLGPHTTKERERARRKSIREKTFLSLPGLLIFREFCLEMNVSMDVKKMNISQMVANLQKFFFFVRVKPGAVLQQLFEQISLVVEAMRGINIRKDPRFKKVVRVCRGRINSFDHIRCHSPQITEQLSMFCLRKLLLSVDVRPNHPAGLFNLTLLYMIIYMCKGTTHWTELKALLVSMRKSSFVCKRDRAKGLKYITIRNEPQCTAGRFYEIPGHPICPFKIFRLFMSKLSVSSNYLWQRPKAHSKIYECWFHPDACNTINNDWLLDLTEKASMTVSYTNMSLVLTPRSVMDSTLADPVFTKSYADEVKEIPDPPAFDPSNLEIVLPGSNDKLEIKLLNSSEAQVEIRLTDILWKELFPEWDRTRLESGYQNHVDFMKHLLEVHKTCKDHTCSNQEKYIKESINGDSATSEHMPQNASTSSMVTTIPINVAQQGIQNSSLLTVVNNNTVPQNVQGAQNFIVPLNTLLESLASTSQAVQPNAGVPLAASSSAVTSVTDTSSLLQNAATLPVQVGRGGPEKTDLPIGQNNSNLHQLTGSSSTVILPSVVSNPLLPLSTVTSTPNQPITDSSSSELLAGKNIIQSLVDNVTKLSPGLQGVNLQSLPLPVLESVQNGTTSSGGANSTSVQNSPLNVQPLPGLSGSLHTAGSETLLTNGLPNLATPGLQNIVTSGGSLSALKNVIPLLEPQIVPASGVNGFQQIDPVSKQSSSVLQGTQLPGQQVITSSNGRTNTALLTNRINTFAEQLTSTNTAGSTFVITNHGIIAVPNIQQPPQTVVVGTHLNDSSSVSTVGASPVTTITESEVLGRENGSDPSPAVSLVTHCQGNFTEEGGESFSQDDYNHELPVKALDYSTKSHVSDTECYSEEVEEAPLDLSMAKPKRKLQLTQNSALTSLVPPLPTVDDQQATGRKCRVEESQVVVPHNNNTWSDASTSSSGRKPPPPYPGVTQKVLATQSVSQLGYPRFVREPSKDYPGFMKMTLKRKSSTGKSVRELLDKKRKNDLAKASPAPRITDSVAVGTLASFPQKLGVGVDLLRHRSGDRVRKKVKVERAGNDISDNGCSQLGIDSRIPTASIAETTGAHHSLITLAAFHKQEMGECSSENGQPDQSDLTQGESVDEKNDLSELKCSPSPVQGCRPGRKSRRKPQQVFKRNLAEDLDVIEEIEGFS